MAVKKKKLKKSVKRGLVVLIGGLVLAIALGIGGLFFPDQEIDEQRISYLTQNLLEKKEGSMIKISYPQFGYENFDELLKNQILDKKQEFLEEVKETKEIKPDFMGEMIVSYEVFTQKSLISVHLSFLKYLGGAHYMQEDQTYYFDIQSKEVIEWKDLFVDAESALNQLSSLSLKQLKEMSLELWEEEDLKKGISGTLENYKHLYLEEDGIRILLPVYQVGPRSTGNIWIYLKSEQVNELLKENYQGTVVIKSEPETEASERNLRDLTGFENKKLVALTFDDGPSYGITENLLDGLKERNAKVTFFVLGSRVEQYPEVVHQAYLDGHTICSHSYDHKNLLNLDEEALREDIKKTNEAVFSVIQAYPFALRPPYGNYDQSIIEAAGIPVVLWNVDPEDWKNRDAEITYQNMLNHIEDGSIILLHDLYGTSVDAALKLIDDLSEQGYEFVSLEELQKLNRLPSESGVISGFSQ